MYSSSRKRKQKSQTLHSKSRDLRTQLPEVYKPDPALFVQAYEADIARGPRAWAAASSLEYTTHNGGTTHGDVLIMLNHSLRSSYAEDETQVGVEEDSNAIWVDRYDARLLLDSLPEIPPTASADAGRYSPTGWSDLPSDAEDTFFFSHEEAEDYRRDKRRRIIDRSREERLKSMRAEVGEEEEPIREEDEWGGSDEEADESQKELMRRTAAHILRSPNPAQLEMRILANHGADRRFAFLRGRWSRTWKIAKGRARLGFGKEKQAKEEEKPAALGGLTGYGDSDEESGSLFEAEPLAATEANAAVNDAMAAKSSSEEQPISTIISDNNPMHDIGSSSEEALKEARRARAREWAEKRRALKANTTSQ